MSTLVFKTSRVRWNGKTDHDDQNIMKSVARELLTAFSKINWDCQKIAEHAEFYRYSSWSEDYSYRVDKKDLSDSVVPNKFQFEYGGSEYTVYVSEEY